MALSRAIMRLSRRIQASVFDRWMEYTHESVAANTELAEWERKVRRAEKFAKSFGRKSLRAAFNRWHEATIERSSMRRKALNAIARFGKRRMVLTFDLWAGHVATVQRQRALANRVAAKLTRRAFAEAFHDWRLFTEARREQKVREQKEWLIKLRKAERFALAWRKNSIAFAFIRWRNQLVRSRAHRAKLRVAVNRMSQRRLFAAFNGWLDQAKELRRQRVIVTRAVMRMSRRLLAGAFYDWQRKVSASADFAEKVAVSERFLAGIKSRTLFRSFYGWRDRVRSLIEQEVKVRRSVLRLQDNTMGHFFFDWHEKLLAKRAHVEREERERKVWEHKLRRAERFILAWQNRTVSDAFSQWHSNWRDIRLERNRIKVVVARMTKRLLFAAWGAWCGTIIDTRRQRKVVRLVLVRIMDRLRATSFYDWVDKVQAKKEHSRREQDEWQVNMVKTRRFVLAWQNQRMNAAFICWQSNWVEMKRQRKILENCVKRMTHRLVFAAFAEWADTTVELKRDRNILRRAAMRMSRRQLASAFFDWHAHVAEGKEWAQKVLISERFLQAIHSGVKYRAFFRWADAVRELKEMRVRVARVLNRMLGRTLANAFFDWNAWVVEERRWRTSLARCERFALALRNRTAFAAFARWREAAVETVTLRRELAKCLGRFRHRAASSAFQGWRDGAAEFRTQRIYLTRCAARWNNNKVRAAFDGWYDSYAETVRLHRVRLQERVDQPQAPEQHWSLFLVLHFSPVAIFQSADGHVGAAVVEEVVDGVLAGAQEKKRDFVETIELQIGLKNYDPQKDKRFAGNIKLPHIPRPKMKVCVLGDAYHCEKAAALGLEFKNAEGLKNFNKNKKLIKKFAKKYHNFLASESLIKQIPRLLGPGLNKAGKFPTLVQQQEELSNKVDEINSTIKFQLKKVLCLNVEIGRAHV